MSVSLRHRGTGRVKILEEGWSWSCFLGASFLGLPLFKRGLIVWGSAMLVLDIATFVVGWASGHAAAGFYFWMSLIVLAASVFFGLRANDMAAQHALSRGWQFADPRRQWFD